MPVITTDYSSLGSTLFGLPDQNTVSYFDNVRESINQRADSYHPDFLQTSNQIFESVYSDRAMELTRAAINKAGSLFSPDVIKELKTISDMQVAKQTMQRFIMANETVRDMWQNRKCEGFADTYIDFEPKAIGENHYDFRRVMDGVVRENKETGEFFVRTYFEELREDDVPLSTGDKIDILNTWNNVEYMMAMAAKDPTSPWNSDL